MARCPICRVRHHRLGRRSVMSALAAAPRAIARALGRASRRRLARRPRRGEWSPTEVLGQPAVRMSPAQRRAAGRHPEYGRLRVAQILTHWAEHDLHHIEQIRAALRAQRSAVRR